MADIGKERAIVYENTPHLTISEWIMLLFYQEGKGPSKISKKNEIWKSLVGLLTIAGGRKKARLTFKDGLNIASMYGTNTNYVAAHVREVKLSNELSLTV